MADETRDLGIVERITADAVGVPGARRFRLRARTASEYALLAVEREQTQALMVALEQLLAQIQVRRRERPTTPIPEAGLDDYPPSPTIEFTVGRMGIGFDEERDLVVMELTDIAANLRDVEASPPEREGDGDDDPPPTLVLRCTRPQAAALREQCETTLAGGRPRCPLCGAPMGPNGEHFCIRANGHGHRSGERPQ